MSNDQLWRVRVVALAAALAAVVAIALMPGVPESHALTTREPGVIVQETFPFVTTTTLAREAGNNTSGSTNLAGARNGNVVPGNVSKLPIRSLLYGGATTKIFAHVVPWFGPGHHDDIIQVGYRSDDPAQVARQVDDMLSRGIQGAVLDWYGNPAVPPGLLIEDTGSRLLMAEAERRGGQFEFAIMIDAGALRPTWCQCNDATTKLINDLIYVRDTFATSSAYAKQGVRPIIYFFDISGNQATPFNIDWARVRSSISFNPVFIDVNAGAFGNANMDGAYSWVYAQDYQSPAIWGEADFKWFFDHADAAPSKLAIGGTYKGFDGRPTPPEWSGHKFMDQDCGQVWLKTFSEIGKYRSSSNQLPLLQLVTWNDYEEGTTIETGIDNCLTIQSSLSGNMLSWAITGVGAPSTIHHYTLFASQDGQNLAVLLDNIPASQRAVDLSAFQLAPGTYTVYVKAVGQPSLLNHMSSATSYVSPSSGPQAFLEPGGQVMIAAEHAHDAIRRSNHAWTLNTDRTNFLGSGAMLAGPDTDANLNGSYPSTSPELRYRIRFSTTGTYYVWLRVLAASGTEDSVHVGLDGNIMATSEDMSLPAAGPYNAWAWMGRRMNGAVASVTIPTVGEHTINVWMREDGFRFDRLFLTVNSGTTPTGTGPVESPRVVTAGVAGCLAFGGVATMPIGDGGCKLDATFLVADVVPVNWKVLYWNGQAETWANAGDTIRTQTASFYRVDPPLPPRTVVVTKAGAGSGTVSSSDSKITCGSTCSATYASGAQIALSAIPATGSAFSGWSGACSGTENCTVTMNDTKTVIATFHRLNVGVVVSPAPGVSPSGDRILAATLSVRGGCDTLDHIQFGTPGQPFDNARVGISSPLGGPNNQISGFTYTPPAGTTSVSLTFERVVQSGGAMVSPIHFYDRCGDWQTFVGGGSDAFR